MSCSKKYGAKRYYIENILIKSDFDKYLDYKESKRKIIDYGTKKNTNEQQRTKRKTKA